MKGSLIVGVLLAATLVVSPSVHTADAPDRPPGVTKNAWIPISDRVGFVVVAPNKGPVRNLSPEVLMVAPPVTGYFMVKGASGGWRRIVIVDGPPIGPGGAG